MTGQALALFADAPAELYREGACRDNRDTELFTDGRRLEQAKRICNGLEVANIPPCPVRDLCRQWAIEHPNKTVVGVWGGLAPSQRRDLKPKRGRGG